MIKISKRTLLASIGAIAALTMIAVGAIMRPDDRAGPCLVVRATTNVPQIPEASGVAVSRKHQGILWSHNDSGHAPELFALDAAGAVRARVRLPIVTRDWEDISAAACPAGDCLYIADIGDNRLARRHVRIHRVPEPALGDAQTAAPDSFTATYADGAHNAEALFLVGEEVFVITRDRTGALYRSTLPRGAARELTLERVGALGLGAVTDAEASPDEASVVVRTSKRVVVYRASDLLRGDMSRARLDLSIEGLKESQGEGVALDREGMLYLVSEGRPWNRAGRFMSLRCPLP